ncbi:MAG: hypothetical protein ACPGF7_10390 [Pontibacterium sp.]
MKALCITGASGRYLAHLEAGLQKAGMAAPCAIDRASGLDIYQWHRRVSSQLKASGTMGRLWDQLGSELLFENLKQDFWGWATPESITALDFWVEQDPGIYFVLLCSTPEQSLARSLMSDQPEQTAEKHMKLWFTEHEKKLAFYFRHPKRCIMLNLQDSINSPESVIAALVERWQLPFENVKHENSQTPDFEQPDSLGVYLASQLLYAERGNYAAEQVENLSEEITATLFPLAVRDDEDSPSKAVSLLTKSIKAFQKMSARVDESTVQTLEAQLKEQQWEVTRRQQENRLKEQEIKAFFADHEKLKKQFEKQRGVIGDSQQEKDALEEDLFSLRLEVSDKQRDFEIQLDKSQGECENLLVKLHQTHEEFEASYMKQQQEKEVLLDDIEKHIVEKRKLEKIHFREKNGLEQEVRPLSEGAKQQLHHLEMRLSEAQNESESLLVQFHQTHEEFETLYAREQQEKKSLVTDIDGYVSEKQKLIAEHFQEKSELKQEINQLSTIVEQQQRDIEMRLSGIREECESLLVQLHQTHEEFEALYVREQEEKKSLVANIDKHVNEKQKIFAEHCQEKSEFQQEIRQLTAGSEQLQRGSEMKLSEAQKECENLLIQLHKAHEKMEFYYQTLQASVQENGQLNARLEKLQRGTLGLAVSRINVSSHKSRFGKSLKWHLDEVELAGDEIPGITLDTFIKSGRAGLQLSRHTETDATSSLLAQWPAADGEHLIVHPSDLSLLAQLNDRDYQRIYQLPILLEKLLPQTELSHRVQKRWSKALKNLQQALDEQPARLHFSGVELLHEQVNPDYEHLWLRLKSPCFGQRKLEDWPFRLSCAGVRSNHFGQQPKLEFPEQSSSLLKEWFAESKDDFGENKLELRFALPNGMDMGIWKRLCADDQQLLSALIQQMPFILNQLRLSGNKLSRSWDDWHQLASNIQHIHKVKG